MDDLLYFSNRKDGILAVKAWVYKKECPKCKKALMGKPLDSKTGRVKIRAIEYSCPQCGYIEEKKAHEESLTLEAAYTCPACGKSGEGTTQYKRKTFQGVPSYLIECANCANKIAITKKLRALKVKGAKAAKAKAAAAEEVDAEEV